MTLSVFYHTFGCIDEQQRDWWLRADVYGISVALCGKFFRRVFSARFVGAAERWRERRLSLLKFVNCTRCRA